MPRPRLPHGVPRLPRPRPRHVPQLRAAVLRRVSRQPAPRPQLRGGWRGRGHQAVPHVPRAHRAGRGVRPDDVPPLQAPVLLVLHGLARRQYLHSIYTVSTQYLHSIYTVSTLYLHSIYTISPLLCRATSCYATTTPARVAASWATPACRWCCTGSRYCTVLYCTALLLMIHLPVLPFVHLYLYLKEFYIT